MKIEYPDLEEVKGASLDKLFFWYKFLPSPGMVRINQKPEVEKTFLEISVLTIIVERILKNVLNAANNK